MDIKVLKYNSKIIQHITKEKYPHVVCSGCVIQLDLFFKLLERCKIRLLDWLSKRGKEQELQWPGDTWFLGWIPFYWRSSLNWRDSIPTHASIS